MTSVTPKRKTGSETSPRTLSGKSEVPKDALGYLRLTRHDSGAPLGGAGPLRKRIDLSARASGGIGRRAGFRFQCLRTWGFKSPLAHARSGEVVRSHRFIFAASQTNDPDGLAMLLTPFSSAAETTALDWGESGSGLFVIEKS